jgi:hypothetical protein
MLVVPALDRERNVDSLGRRIYLKEKGHGMINPSGTGRPKQQDDETEIRTEQSSGNLSFHGQPRKRVF